VRTVFRNGVVHARAEGAVQALAVQDGRVVWLGRDDEIGVLDGHDEVVDLDGALVAPGFVDSHAHVLETGLSMTGANLSGATSLTAALDRLARAAATGAEPVLGHGWDETGWPERRPPTRAEVDRATGGARAYLSRTDLHSAVVSSALAEAADCAGAPGWRGDGLVTGEAHNRSRAAIRDLPEDRRDDLCRVALACAAAAGVVSLHEQSTPVLDSRAGLASLIASSADAGSGLPQVAGYRAELCVTTDDARALLAAVPGLAGIGGDLAVDGSLGSRTAALRSPYLDGEPGNRGSLNLTAEQIANHVGAATRAGAPTAFHVIGDRAMEEVLLGFQAAGEVEGFDRVRAGGHRLEHAEMVDAAAMARILLFGLTLSVQPAFDAAWGGSGGMYTSRLGPVRATDMNPFADLLSAGVPIAFGSDSPVTPIDPWSGVRAAVQHRERSQRVALDAAFRAHTVGGWGAAPRRADGAGELRIGAPASFAVWYADALAAPVPPRIATWRDDPPPLPLPDLTPGAALPVCLLTVRDGVVIHRL
jgi:predicted amidohydrolase YtcJ